MKKLVSFITAVVFVLNTVSAFSLELTDTKVFTDPIQNTYIGRDEAKNMISNLNFTDVNSGYWAYESIVKAGALDMVKGYDRTFNPNGVVSNQEAIAFAVRVMGLENEAQTEAARLENLNSTPASNSVRPVWSIGYLSLAMQNGLITNAQFNDAINQDQNTILPEGFFRGAPVTREQAAHWLVMAINYLSPNLLTPSGSQQKLYSYPDWDSVSAQFAQSMELLLANGIMNGKSNGTLSPKGNLTRAEMAQILSNLDSIYYNAAGLVKKTGTIGGIKDTQVNQTADINLVRNLYVRDMNGKIDVLAYNIESSSSPQAVNKDAVVLKGGLVSGMASLSEGDEIEYIVRNNPDTGENIIMYVKVTNGIVEKEVQGKLIDIDYQTGQIQIVDNLEKYFVYPLADGLYFNEDGKDYAYFGTKKIAESEMPYGSTVKLKIVNNVAKEITYEGTMNLAKELRGIVTENNTSYGYLTVIDNNGNEVTKNYYAGQITVEKQQYYDMDDEIGYYDQIFKNFKYDARDTDISSIEPGDIVFIKTYSDNPDTIEAISASTNYTMKYGKIAQFNRDTINNDNYQMLMQYEDGQTAWFDVAENIFVSKEGKPLDTAKIQAGDWAKILVNQAIISPGYVMESVKEITVEGTGHDISNIVKGTLGSINNIQNQLSVTNAYTLTKSGWADFQQVKNLSIANNDISYYYNGNQVNLDYLMRYLKHADNEVYIALENNYSGEKVSMVSIRNGRDDILEPDRVVNADGVGGFNILSSSGNITTDSGTIVRRHGRLVDGGSIMVPDYARVVLNGNGKAAVVDIYDEPNASGVFIARGRIISVDEGKSFKVKSSSILTGDEWLYTPVERTFEINGSTLFLNEGGISNINSFLDYTTESVEGGIFNIVADGTTATHVIQSPYAKDIVRGTVYDTAAGSISIKDSRYYIENTGRWDTVSDKDNSVNVTLPTNSVIVKNNKVVGVSELEKGDKIKVFTSQLPNIAGGMTVTGSIILVEG